ncbi:hypothetical protein CHH59_14475 [Shouchella clausii]|nr:hypothetical protein CHH59_14475 [Shouchella clausii]
MKLPCCCSFITHDFFIVPKEALRNKPVLYRKLTDFLANGRIQKNGSFFVAFMFITLLNGYKNLTGKQ